MTGKRILILVGVAVGLFVIGVVGLAVLAGILYYEKVDLLDNPVVAFITGTPAPQGSSTDAPSDHPSRNGALTDVGDYQTENNWIAAKTAEEIAGMAWLALHPDKPVPPLKVKATVDPEKSLVHLELTGWSDTPVVADLTPAYAWDPKAYANFAHQLLGDLKPAEPPVAPASDLLSDLLAPTGQVLAAKDVELSQALSQNPASVGLHENAALLLLTLALRENAGTLSDIRPELSRACAHLAIARALAGGDPGSLNGKMDEAALLTLAGREVDANARVAALNAQTDLSPAGKSWTQTLQLLNKQDYRLVSTPDGLPLLVRIAWLQIAARDLDDTVALSYLRSMSKPENVPDWGRALLTTRRRPAVEVGHILCASTLRLEFQELRSILSAEGQTVADSTPLSDVFKNPVGLSVTSDGGAPASLRVIGLNLFEDVEERHLVMDAAEMHFWLNESWGVPDEDIKFCAQMRKLFQGARGEQYLNLLLNSKSEDISSPGDLHADLSEIPPTFAMTVPWAEADCGRLVPYFGWGIPFGAPLDMEHRSLLTLDARLSHHHPVAAAPSFRDLMPLAPDSYEIASWVIVLNEDQHVAMTGKEQYDLLAPFFDDNENALGYFIGQAEKRNDVDDGLMESVRRKYAALDPDEFFNLGDFLMAHGKPDEGADAYRKGVAQGNDQVVMANSVKPLVAYDFDHGNQDEAMSVAKKAADVYSYDGLETYAWLLCKLKRGAEAEAVEKQIQERYGGDPLTSFYAAHGDLFPEQSADALKVLFPNGMKDVTLNSFTGPPAAGCRFISMTPSLAEAGIRTTDVVVALDGHAVDNQNAYLFIRGLSDAPELNLIIWRQNAYQEIKASPPGRRFGSDLADYVAK
jgi:hypothetical protein